MNIYIVSIAHLCYVGIKSFNIASRKQPDSGFCGFNGRELTTMKRSTRGYCFCQLLSALRRKISWKWLQYREFVTLFISFWIQLCICNCNICRYTNGLLLYQIHRARSA